MKKRTILKYLLGFAFGVMSCKLGIAQSREFKLLAGGSVFNHSHETDNPELIYDKYLNFNGFVLGEINPVRMFFVRAGFLYEVRKVGYDVLNSQGPITQVSRSEGTYRYLKIPLLIGFAPFDDKRLSPYLFSGFQFSFKVSTYGKTTLNNGFVYEGPITLCPYDYENPFFFKAGIGIRVRIFDWMGLFVEGFYGNKLIDETVPACEDKGRILLGGSFGMSFPLVSF